MKVSEIGIELETFMRHSRHLGFAQMLCMFFSDRIESPLKGSHQAVASYLPRHTRLPAPKPHFKGPSAVWDLRCRQRSNVLAPETNLSPSNDNSSHPLRYRPYHRPWGVAAKPNISDFVPSRLAIYPSTAHV